jgi:UPF0716 protein FxsA
VFRILTALFLVVPFVELWLLLRVGSALGFWPTMGFVVGTAVLGAWLAKREGLRVLHEWQRAMAELRVPEEGITSGLLVLVGATLLITPGVLTDVVGIALLFPPTRKLVARAIERRARKEFAANGGASSPSWFAHGRGFAGRGGGAVFDVRVVTPEGVFHRRSNDPSVARGGGAPRRVQVVDVEGRVVEERVVEERRLEGGG